MMLLVIFLVWFAANVQGDEHIVISRLDVDVDGAAGRGAKPKRHVTVEDEAGGVIRRRKFTLVPGSFDREALLRMDGVLGVVPNTPIELAAEEQTRQWNLDRVDQAFGRDGVYSQVTETGLNVDLYIIDTGVQATHVAFGGRVQPGRDATVPGDLPADTDCHSHGTHVAGTAAGDIYGIARSALIFPVKVLDCDGRGTLMSLSEGVQWARASILARGTARKPVVNLSIQSSASDVIDELVRSLHQAGAVVTVAGANFNSDACSYSPSREPLAVTVGATSEDDSKLSSSNFGPCIDLFAPGDNILSASPYSPTASAVKRGTSMASPLVAGIVATIRERYPAYTNAQVIQQLLKGTATLGKQVSDTDCSGSLEGERFAQALGASERPVALSRDSILASGDFLLWSPDMTLAEAGKEICVTFTAKILAARASPALASVLVTVSTDVLASGVAGYYQAPTGCRDDSARWYTMDSSKITDFLGSSLGVSVNPRMGALSATEERAFYVKVTRADSGDLTLELGSDGIAIVSATDAGSGYLFPSLTRLSFSSKAEFDILYSGIQSCSDPTRSPTPALVTELTVRPPNRDMFFAWPSSWGGRCFQFTAELTKQAKVYVALASRPMGRVRFNQLKEGGRVLAVAHNHIRLFRDGAMISQQPLFLAPRKRITLRVTNDPDGSMTLADARKGGVIYAHNDSEALFSQGARYSLGSNMPRRFTRIALC